MDKPLILSNIDIFNIINNQFISKVAVTDADGNTIGYGEDKTAIINYVESLTGYGFTVVETGGIEGYVYEWEIKDAAGNTIEVTCAEGYCWIEIVKK